MKVELWAYTQYAPHVNNPNIEDIIRRVASVSYKKEAGEDIVGKLVHWGHESVLEHLCFTFYIEQVSRALTHQLVRHRMASYTQESQRRVKYHKHGGFTFTTPPSLDSPEQENQRRIYEELMKQIDESYRKLAESGVPVEDARFILPNACHTSIWVTMNARELRHFLKLRLAKDSQWEIRELARRMLMIVKPLAPKVFADIQEDMAKKE